MSCSLPRVTSFAPVIAGESSGLVRDICSVREVVERVVREASALLVQWAPQTVSDKVLEQSVQNEWFP
jgi:hypothetical protein